MDKINKNKNIIIICISLIIFFLIIYLIFKPKKEEFLFINNDNYLKDYDINEIIPIYVSEEDIANKYLSEYVNFLLFNKEKAYNLLTESEKNNRFQTYDQFLYYIDKINTIKFKQAKVTKYSYKTYNDKKTLYVVDNSGNTFKFIENSLMDYKVEIN